jgi:hypothetical protein
LKFTSIVLEIQGAGTTAFPYISLSLTERFFVVQSAMFDEFDKFSEETHLNEDHHAIRVVFAYTL